MDSLGSWSMMERATVKPPTPESKTPMGRDSTAAAGRSLASDSAAAPADGSMLEAVVMIIRG
jgi:hypothetical protein